MEKLKVGNKQNSFLNGEWAKHMRSGGKKFPANTPKFWQQTQIAAKI